MDSFGEIKASLSSSGITVDDFDLQIGCTALMLNYTVVSNNTRPFEKIPGLKLANWAG
jgi:tRNA(fMet)-specific endonuclease VapC